VHLRGLVEREELAARGHETIADPRIHARYYRPDMDEPKRQLIRGLTATDTTALVVGTVIGSGVFLKTAVMTQDLAVPALVLAAWVAAGLLSLAGALTYAELGAMLPEAGGEYVYLKKSYGETAAFLFGWQRFIVAGVPPRPAWARGSRSSWPRSCP